MDGVSVLRLRLLVEWDSSPEGDNSCPLLGKNTIVLEYLKLGSHPNRCEKDICYILGIYSD